MADAAIMVLARMRRIASMCAAADFLESRDERARVADTAQHLRRCGGVNTRAVSATCASSSWRLASTSCLAAGCEGLDVDNLRTGIRACALSFRLVDALLSRQLASFWRVAFSNAHFAPRLADGMASQAVLHVDGMVCGSCTSAVNAALRSTPGVSTGESNPRSSDGANNNKHSLTSSPLPKHSCGVSGG